MENRTRLDFEYLGNKYYVVYNKQKERLKLDKIEKDITKDLVPINIMLELQQNVTGKVLDSDGFPLVGASVVVKGTTTGTATDFDGNFTISASDGDTLVVSYIGYETKEVPVGASPMTITLSAGLALESVVVIGSRNANRTATDTPVPVDVLDVTELAQTAPQITVTEILNYAAPSFSSNPQTISDGTDHIAPASLRGLGPDQVFGADQWKTPP